MKLRPRSTPGIRKARNTRRHVALEVMETRQLLATFVVSNNADSGSGSLRQAIVNANNDPGNDTITFNLPANQLTITPQSLLPPLTDSGTTIDGTTEPNYDKTTGKPLVVITGASGVAPGLDVQGGSCTIEGLVINNFGVSGVGVANEAGIFLESLPGDVVQDCYIGTGAAGLGGLGNFGNGIRVTANSCTIGGTTLDQRNVISGNFGYGISVTGGNKELIEGNYIGLGADGSTTVDNFAGGILLKNSVGNVVGGTAAGSVNVISGNFGDGIDITGGGNTGDIIEGNYIGTDATGATAKANTGDGINIQTASSITVGGANTAGNVISGNTGNGVNLVGVSTTTVLVEGNKIGVAADGTSSLPNKLSGVLVNGSLNDAIGGVTAGFGNIIANNGKSNNSAGVNVASGTGIAVLSNSIYSNTNGGINLAGGANSPDNNTSQSAPVLTSAATAAGQTVITGTFSSDPATGANAQFIVQFFANTGADPAGLVEGKTFVDSILVTTDSNGIGSLNFTLPVGTTVGQQLTATVTQEVLNDTSEFSAPVTIGLAPTTDLVVTQTSSPNPDHFTGDSSENETYTVTIKNKGTNDDPNVVYTGLLDANSNFINAVASQLAQAGNPPSFDSGSGTITAQLGTIPAGGSATITIIVSPTTTGSISLTSSASGSLIDTTPGNNTGVVTTVPVNPAAALDVTVIASPSPVALGNTLTYTITVINNGPSTATNAQMVETLPTSVTLGNVNQSQGNGYTLGGAGNNVLTFDLGNIGAQGSATITIQVTPTSVGQITDTATVSSDVFNSDAAKGLDSTTVTTNVANAVDLTIVGGATPIPAVAGKALTFVVSASNTPEASQTISDATNVVITDTLPAGIDPSNITVSTSGSFTITNGVVKITFASVPAGGTPASAAITVIPLTSGTYTNTASVTDATATELNVATGPTTARTTVLASPADMSIQVAANPGIAVLGSPLTYTIIVTNNGPTDAPGVTVIDQLPKTGIAATAQVAASQGSATLFGSLVSASLGTIASGHSATITIIVTPTASTVLTDVASVASADVDPNPANNMAVLGTFVSPDNLVVVGAPSTATPIQGDPFTYGFTVANTGPSTSTNTTMTIALPANTAFVSLATTKGVAVANGHIVSYNVGSLAVGAMATIYVTVIPTATGTLVAGAAATSANFNLGTSNSTIITTKATNFPGVFSLSSTAFAGLETQGYIPITINRANGTLGAIDVTYTTVGGGTAVAGMNYTPTAGVIPFAAGQTTATVLVPVKHDNAITPNLTFGFAITGVDNGGTIAGPAAAVVTIVNVDRDTVPPLVESVTPIEVGNQVAGYVVDYNKAMNPATAANPANYGLFLSGRDLGIGNVPLTIAAAAYNPATDSVTLIPSAPLASNAFYGVIINGASAAGVSDVSGNLLSGDGTGTAGTNYAAMIGIGNSLSYYDSASHLVHLATSNAQMEIVRNLAGDAYDLQLLGVTAGAKIAGSVVGGNTGIAEIDGLGAFGSVNTTGLLTPPFVVSNSNFSSPMPVPQTAALAAAIGDIVPNGPAFVLGRIKAKAKAKAG